MMSQFATVEYAKNSTLLKSLYTGLACANAFNIVMVIILLKATIMNK
jgi:hypothetical protein